MSARAKNGAYRCGVSPTIRIQLVLYQNEFDSLRRTVCAVRACVAHARSSGRISDAVIAIGDCSPEPALSTEQVDDLREVVSSCGATLTHRFFAANLGSAGGSNALAADGQEPLVWILNPDTYPAPTCLSMLLDALQETGVAAAEARQLPIEHPKGYDPVTGEATWITGACIVTSRAAFEAVGGFDDRHFPLYCDDVDLSWRWRMAGFTLRTVPRATVFHDKRPGPDGRPAGGEVEIESSSLARLKLARRFGRPDAEARDHAAFAASPLGALQRAAARYDELAAAGDLPQPLPGAEAVAAIDVKYYGPHRFRYDQ